MSQDQLLQDSPTRNEEGKFEVQAISLYHQMIGEANGALLKGGHRLESSIAKLARRCEDAESALAFKDARIAELEKDAARLDAIEQRRLGARAQGLYRDCIWLECSKNAPSAREQLDGLTVALGQVRSALSPTAATGEAG